MSEAIAGLEARINEYQGRLNSQPATEQQLDDITRGYEQSKANYDDLLKKKNNSVMATSMEQMQQGERFTVLDPPSLPDEARFSESPEVLRYRALWPVWRWDAWSCSCWSSSMIECTERGNSRHCCR